MLLLLQIPPLPDDSDDEAAAFKPLGEVPELSDGFESVPDLPSECCAVLCFAVIRVVPATPV